MDKYLSIYFSYVFTPTNEILDSCTTTVYEYLICVGKSVSFLKFLSAFPIFISLLQFIFSKITIK